MRKNKGYQREGKVGYSNPGNSYASGNNKNIEQIIEDTNNKIDDKIANIRKEYEYALKEKTLNGKELYNVKFDNNFNLIPLEEVIENVNKNRARSISKELHGWGNYGYYYKRIIHKDNQKFVYNTGNVRAAHPLVRIPSLKRSKQVWKRFYELFPKYEEMSHDPELRRRLALKKL